MDVKFPNVSVALVGQDGNVFNLIGLCRKAMLRAGVPKEDIVVFQNEVMQSGSYGEALQIMMRTLNVE